MKRLSNVVLAGLVAVMAASSVSAQPCVIPDDGTGTVNLPPIGGPGCGYLSPDDVHMIIDGLPPGTTIILGAAHSRFGNVIHTPGGPLGGEREQFNSEVLMQVIGTGDLAGFNRTINMVNVQVITDTAPRGTGSPQSFDTDMFGMQGQLPPGDPDFDLLRITAGTGFGMPSPGHTTLTRLGPPGSDWQVDSFFDVFYRIDFIGHPGGPLGGMSGSTTGTIRMQTGGGGAGGVGCCLPLGLCVNTSSVATCIAQNGIPVQGGCAGDIDGDGIDEACFAPPCVQCGPGPHWIDNPPCPPGGQGQDTLPSGAVLGIDTNFDCIADINVIAGGPVTITKRGPFDDATFFPATRPIDGHLDVIDTEIIAMSLTGGGVTLRAGTMSGSMQPLQPSRGAVAEQPSNPNLADSFFDVFFEVDLGGIQYYNHTPIQVAQVIDCMPPKDNYHHLGGCTPLYNSPFAPAIHVANLVQANHFTYPSCCLPVVGGGSACSPNVPVQQCQAQGGTPVPACLGDGNGNGSDDACEPKCERDPTTPSGCSQTCPPPVGVNDQCLPKTAGCNPNEPGSCGVLSCECQDANVCHLEKNTATGAYECLGGCPVPPGGLCTLLGDGAFDNPFRCDCVGSPGCVPNADASDCENTTCPDPTVDTCHKKCVKIDAAGNIEVTDCECEPATDCHVETHQGPVPRAFDGGVAGGGNGCIVPDNGGGTVALPPAGCDYLSPAEVHAIIDGLPANTTLQLAPIHQGIFCREQNPVCSFPPGVDCTDAGGVLGGEKECNASQLQFQLTCVATGPGGCPGALNGWSRPVLLPDVGFETHTAPRTPGDPVQSFDTQMFRLFGQITNPGSGDPDFDLLRVVAGNDFGLPSPGHTTLTQLPGGNWAVDSFFDITYRIDFVGRPGGPLGGMSGSTTGTIRMQTTPPVKCDGDCPIGTVCEQTNVPQADGTNKICCDCVTPPPVCEALPDASGCTTTCPNPADEQCLPQTGGCNPNQPGTCGILSCDCQDPNVCHLVRDAAGYHCEGGCPVPPGGTCTLQGTGGFGDPYHCDCVQPSVCEPNSTGTDCQVVPCPGPIPPIDRCLKKCVTIDADGNVVVTDCECQPDTDCHVELSTAGGRPGGMEFDGGVAGGPNDCIVADDGGTVDLPPVGCDYLSPDEVHMIIDGLPPGTTINLAPIHRDFICHKQPGGAGVCSFPPLVDCEQNGGSLGGEQECADSTLHFDAQCVGTCPGGLAGFARPIDIPISFETHTAPRTPGDPVQSFDTDMFRLFGQITGDPDFDLLRVVGGTDFGLPSPGHTTLTQIPGGNWAVDSFFDITYRIDFVGSPGGPLAGMSGSTTGTIRMQTKAPFKCRGGCPANTTCTQTNVPQPDGTNKVCCDCVNNDPTGVCCTTGAAGNLCVNTTQSQCQGTFLPGQVCSGIIVACCLPSGACAQMDEVCCAAAGGASIVGGTCSAPQGCCLPNGTCQNLDPVCCSAQNGTSLGAGNFCAGDVNGNGVDDACENCEPTPDGTGCSSFCPPSPIQNACHQRCAKYNPATGQIQITDCDCRGTAACHLVYFSPAGGRDEGGVAGGPNGCVEPDSSGTVVLPPPNCGYVSPDDAHAIIAGLPAGTTIQIGVEHERFFNIQTQPGGSLGGEIENFGSFLSMDMQGQCTGPANPLCTYNRSVDMQIMCQAHTGPRTPGQTPQSFPNDMFMMQGQLPPGDPDFDLLRITGGTKFGMPSPGHTTLTRLGPPGSSWAVDSFFDITYRIDFVGAPGGPFAGMSGSTTGTIRMGTKAPFKCVGGCGPRRVCTPRASMNVDGTLDVCCDCRPRPPIDTSLSNKPRFVSFSLDPAVIAGGSDETAIRLRLVSLHHVNPPYSGAPSIPFTAFEGEVRYAGPPAVYLESSSSSIRFIASNLQCDPYYRDWSSFNSCSTTPTLCTTDTDCPMGGTCTVPVDSVLHTTGSAITPSSTYDVEVLGSSCVGVEDTCGEISDPLEIKTTRWGDVLVPFAPPSLTVQPDISDISGLVDKFRSAPTAPIKAQALLAGAPGNLFGEITPAVISVDYSFSHISSCVDAFRGLAYPYAIESCP